MKVLAGVLLFAMLAQCNGPRDARFKPREMTMTGRILPPDVIARGVQGIFPIDAQTSDTDLCCWMSPRASFRVYKRQNARRLVLGVYIPDVDLYRSGGQQITVALPRFRQQKTFDGLHTGFHELAVQLTPAAARARGPQSITTSAVLVYAPGGANGPRYAALLVSAYFQ